MQTYTFQQNVNEFFVTPGRTRQALILCQNAKGDFILGKKKSYPQGISRMVGGGIDDNENPLEGTIRELKEELDIDVSDSDLKELCLVSATFNKGDKQESLNIYVHYCNLNNTNIIAGDDVADFAYLSLDKVTELVNTLSQLTGTYPDKYGNASEMSWSDWGKFHSFILQKTIDSYLLNNLKLST